MPRFLNIQPNSRTPDLRFAFRWPCVTPTCLPLDLTGVWHSGIAASTDSSIGLKQGYAIDFLSPITCSGDMAPASSMPSPGRSERYSVENRRNTNSRRMRDSSDTRCICVWTTWCIYIYKRRMISGNTHDWLRAQGAKPKKANDSRMTHEITCYHMMCRQCQ